MCMPVHLEHWLIIYCDRTGGMQQDPQAVIGQMLYFALFSDSRVERHVVLTSICDAEPQECYALCLVDLDLGHLRHLIDEQ